MTETEQMNENERIQFTEFKRKLSLQAAQAQVGKIEYNLSDASVDRGTLRKACQDANALNIGAVCVLPDMVKAGKFYLGRESKISVIAVISYPHGGDVTKVKAAAVKNAVKDGADEVEVTVPIAYIKEKGWSYVKREFKKIKSAAKKSAVRINLESALIGPEEISKVCVIATDCGITSIKTSSDSESISRIHTAVKDKCTIKADGIGSVSDMITAVSMGAGVIGSKNALELARLVLQNYDY